MSRNSRRPAASGGIAQWVSSPLLWGVLAVLFLAVAVVVFFTAPPSVFPSGSTTIDYSSTPPPTIKPALLNVFPHDPTAFTQGLVVVGGSFYESTGWYGQSTVRHVEVATGNVLASVPMDSRFFGEGLCLFNDTLYQITWQERTIFMYERATLRTLGAHHLHFEGWGLTHDEQYLILSDGSSNLYWIDPANLMEHHRVSVRVAQGAGKEPLPLARLNELEYIDGMIFANVWMEDRIAVIDPSSGFVRAFLNVGYVYPRHERPNDNNAVLNGIAFESLQRRLFITGKRWPLMFEIALPTLP
jgi:glutamine cyclotransferase